MPPVALICRRHLSGRPIPSPRAKPSAELSKVLQFPSIARPRILAKPTWKTRRLLGWMVDWTARSSAIQAIHSHSQFSCFSPSQFIPTWRIIGHYWTYLKAISWVPLGTPLLDRPCPMYWQPRLGDLSAMHPNRCRQLQVHTAGGCRSAWDLKVRVQLTANVFCQKDEYKKMFWICCSGKAWSTRATN